MKNIYSNIFKVNNKNLSKALNCLKKKQLVGVPTETVYGLAGNAYSRESVGSIYAFDDSVSCESDLKRLEKEELINKIFCKIYKAFCPGPITFILKKKKDSLITNLATSGLKTIAVRFPNNKIIRKILKQLKFPLAIPSANKSTKVSPVSAQDVSVDFGGSLKLILDDGSCDIGIESTVVDLTSKVKILRPGFVNPKEIGKVLKCKVTIDKKSLLIKSPGMLKRHYSPGIPLKHECHDKPKNDEAFIIIKKKKTKLKNYFYLTTKNNLDEAAKNLYSCLRKIKNQGYKSIAVEKIPNIGLGMAINDRLYRASKL